MKSKLLVSELKMNWATVRGMAVSVSKEWSDSCAPRKSCFLLAARLVRKLPDH